LEHDFDPRKQFCGESCPDQHWQGEFDGEDNPHELFVNGSGVDVVGRNRASSGCGCGKDDQRKPGKSCRKREAEFLKIEEGHRGVLYDDREANSCKSGISKQDAVMPSDQVPLWYLKKHGDGATHGPVSFDQLRNWAGSAQINPHDLVSNDSKIWNKAPMVAELEMDWLIEVPDNPLYGPTTAGAVMEFFRMGEVCGLTIVLNCCTGASMPLEKAPFFHARNPGQVDDETTGSLLKRIADLESQLEERGKELALAKQTIDSLHRMVGKIDSRLRD
jgi:hypothetical protein